jgi:transcriptional regulator GlxA family with amidase domain
MSPPRSVRRVVLVAVAPVRALDLFGPAEVFGEANRQHGGDPVYAVTIVSGGTDRLVQSEVLAPVAVDTVYADHDGPIDTLLVAGGEGASERRYAPAFLDWLRAQCGAARRFGSVCTGAFVLADAGLLDGRSATTHWGWCRQLTRDYPRVRVDPDPIYVRDGNCYTSAGVTAGIDLSLALVEEDLGSGTALRVARMMVVFLRRPGGQSQFSATLAAQTLASPQLGDLLAWIPDNLRRALSVEQLARRVAMSPRNFARLFRREVGRTPGKHVEELRLEAARRYLESTGDSLAQVAAATGFRSAETLGRAFVRRFGTTPGQYRASFGMAGIVGSLSENALRGRRARL